MSLFSGIYALVLAVIGSKTFGLFNSDDYFTAEIGDQVNFFILQLSFYVIKFTSIKLTSKILLSSVFRTASLNGSKLKDIFT